MYGSGDMRKNKQLQAIGRNLEGLPLEELRQKWASAWGIKPHRRISTPMLIRSLEYKLQEQAGEGLTPAQQVRLDQLVKSFKRNPKIFDEGMRTGLKSGTRLVREWNGRKHNVLVRDSGFEYEGKIYSSLSEVATLITGTRWNGWVFFGLKGKSAKGDHA